MKAINPGIALFFVLGFTAAAQHAPAGNTQPDSGNMMPHPSHAAGAPITYTELKKTVAELERAKQATAKYQDVHVAEADGYQVVGPDFPGMGVHFVLTMEPKGFDIEKPPILLYQKDAAAPGGYSLVGVSYLWNAPEGPDGQPLNPPFPKSLALWHRHTNICVLAHLENPHGLTEAQCRERGGALCRSESMVGPCVDLEGQSFRRIQPREPGFAVIRQGACKWNEALTEINPQRFMPQTVALERVTEKSTRERESVHDQKTMLNPVTVQTHRQRKPTCGVEIKPSASFA